MTASFEQARGFFLQGLAHYQAGRFEAAERDFAASLSLVPGRASTLTNLGAARLKLGRAADAIPVLEEAIAQEPGNAEALGHLAAALAESGRREPALQAVTRALALDPKVGAAWTLRGTLERELGLAVQAAASYRQALAHGADPELMQYYLAALAQDDAPAAPPRHYVEQLFDAYAEDFDQHLTGSLQYRGPQILAQGLPRKGYRAALDLGCGTGLCAPVLRPLAKRLDAIDLSANMVRIARGRGLYDEVLQGDAQRFLQETDRRYDLVVAADVFIYVGALDPMFAAVARVMEAGGDFCFSLEAEDGQQDYRLRTSLRYAHSERYIRMLATQHGFEVAAMARHPLRIDQGQPVGGLFAWLARPGQAA